MKNSAFIALALAVMFVAAATALAPVPILDDNSAAAVAAAAVDVKFATFLVAVNHTWDTCLAQVVTPQLQPNQTRRTAPSFQVGACDYGPLTFSVGVDRFGKPAINVIFYSSVIMDASPPSCSIPFTVL